MEMKDTHLRDTNDIIAACVLGVNVDFMRNPKNFIARILYNKEAIVFNILVHLKIYILRSLLWLT